MEMEHRPEIQLVFKNLGRHFLIIKALEKSVKVGHILQKLIFRHPFEKWPAPESHMYFTSSQELVKVLAG